MVRQIVNRLYGNLNKVYVDTLQPWTIWLIVIVCILFQFILQVTTGLLTIQIMDDFKIDAFDAGLLIGAYYYVYSLLQFPAGFMIDRYGAHKLLTYGYLVSGIGCFIFASTHHFWIAMIARIAIGAGMSFTFVAFVYLTAIWMNTRLFPFFVSFGETIPILGSTLGELYLSTQLDNINWRSWFELAGYVSIFLCVVVAVIVKDKTELAEQRMGWKNFFKLGRQLIGHGPIWLNSLYLGGLFSIVTVFIGVWGHQYLELAHHIDAYQAALLCSALMFGITVGAPTTSWLSGHIKSIRSLLIISALLVAVLFTSVVAFPHINKICLSVILFVIGFFASVYVISYPIAHYLAPVGAKSTYVGFTNMICAIFAPILISLIGYIIDYASHLHNHGVYLIRDYQIGLLCFPVILCICVILAIYLPNMHQPNTIPSA